jgi:hypothetical protein
MGVIQDKANAIAQDMAKNEATLVAQSAEHGEHRVGFIISITIIAAIIDVIWDLIQMYQSCKQTPQQAAVSMRSGGVLERLRLRRAIRNNSNLQECHDAAFDSTLSIATQVQDDEVGKMYEEVNVPLV